MTGSLTLALDLLRWIAGQIGSLTPLLAIQFDEPDPAVGVAGLPGFATLEEPTMRRCCAIGWRPSRKLFPALTATKPMQLGSLGRSTHEYGGPTISGPGDLWGDRLISHDPVGHLYTARGGIIDVGHVRDHADLARYLANHAHSSLAAGGEVTLTSEAGVRKVRFIAGSQPTPRLSALIGARASYDLAIWHEIVTWAATGGIASQPYSAFSPEDNYSNLLGAYLGYRAVLTPQPFDAALSELLATTLLRLGAASRAVVTEAVDYVEGHWFRYDDSNLELLRREFGALGTVVPWLITHVEIAGREAQLESIRSKVGHPVSATPIVIPEDAPGGGKLSDRYETVIEIDNGVIDPAFVDNRSTITDADFPALIAKVKAEVLAQYPQGDRRD